MTLRRDDLPRAAVVLGLLAALIYSAWNLIPRLSPVPEFDARETYLPFARKLLDTGTAFLGSEQSIWVAPFAYVYPAIFGADAMGVKIAAVVLFLALILIVYRIGTLLHSRRAGVAAALLLAASPTIKIFIPTALTEPPFIFLVGVWVWAMCEGHCSARTRWWVIAGLALGLATLTRSTYQLFIPVAIAGGLLLWRLSNDVSHKRDGRGIAIAHGVALTLLLLVIARNAVVFGFPSISTGAGAGLFLGSNPMTDGYDAGYFGLLLDDGTVHLGKGHLSIEGDRLLRGVALTALRDQPLGVLAQMYVQKIGAFLFVTQAEWQGTPEILRGWRAALILLALYGWWHIKAPALRVLLGAAFLYQVAVHVPVLYSFRYSVSAVDLPLTIMAGIGVAAAFARPRHTAALCGLALLCAMAGALSARYQDPPSPHIGRAHHVNFWQMAFSPPLEANSAKAIEIEVRNAPGLHPWDNSLLVIDVSATTNRDARCRAFTVSYRRKGEAEFKGAVRRLVTTNAEVKRFEIGTRVPLELYAEGTLRVAADCDAGATLQVHGARIAAGRFASVYRARYLGEPLPAGVLLPTDR